MPEFIDAYGKKACEKETVFTHIWTFNQGWIDRDVPPPDTFELVIYLGRCKIDGDMFAAHDEGYIDIFKGVKGSEFNQ